ncbi:MAG: hypothetical protein ABSC34_00540 [Acidimicrobiales bacterium]
MNGSLLAAGAALGAVPVVFVVLLSVLILLGVRAWCGVFAVPLTRQVTRLLDGSVVFLFVLFIALVIFRFKTIG